MVGVETLVVSEDEKITELLKNYLTQAGFNVSFLNRGDGVINEAKFYTQDLMILDIMLPGKDNIEICKKSKTLQFDGEEFFTFLLSCYLDEIRPKNFIKSCSSTKYCTFMMKLRKLLVSCLIINIF